MPDDTSSTPRDGRRVVNQRRQIAVNRGSAVLAREGSRLRLVAGSDCHSTLCRLGMDRVDEPPADSGPDHPPAQRRNRIG